LTEGGEGLAILGQLSFVIGQFLAQRSDDFGRRAAEELLVVELRLRGSDQFFQSLDLLFEAAALRIALRSRDAEEQVELGRGADRGTGRGSALALNLEPNASQPLDDLAMAFRQVETGRSL
jgi:hypothetical protein